MKETPWLDTLEQALLAFIGTAEAGQKHMLLSAQNERNQQRVAVLVSKGMVKTDGDKLAATIDGWRFLDSRSR